MLRNGWWRNEDATEAGTLDKQKHVMTNVLESVPSPTQVALVVE